MHNKDFLKETTFSFHKSDCFLLCVLLTIGFALFFTCLVWSGQLSGAEGPRDLYSSQVARNIAAGRGLTTDVIYPLCLKVRAGDLTSYPEMLQAPLYPVFLSLFFLLFGPHESSVVLFCLSLYMSSIVLFYFIVIKLFDRRTAFIGVLLYAGNFSVLYLTIQNPGFWLLMILFSLFAFSLYRPGPSPRGLVFSGAFMGAIYLCKYDTIIIVLPCTLIYLWLILKEQRWRNVGYFFGAFFVIAFPFMLRNTILGVNPVFGLSFYRPAAAVQEHVLECFSLPPGLEIRWSNFIPALTDLFRVFVKVMGNYTPVFVIFALLTGIRDIRRWVIFLLAVFTLHRIFNYFFLIGFAQTPLTSMYIPVFSVAGTIGFLVLMDRFFSPRSRGLKILVTAAFVFINVLPLIVLSYPKVASSKSYAIWPFTTDGGRYNRIMRSGKGENHLILSDSPETIAWYSGAVCVKLPQKPANIVEIQELYPDIKGILFTGDFQFELENNYPLYEKYYWLARDGYKPRFFPYSRSRIDEYEMVYLFSPLPLSSSAAVARNK